MTFSLLTRRQVARIVLTGAATTLVPASVGAQTAPSSPSEVAALAEVVPFNVGYVLTATQTAEVAAALKGYAEAVSKARAFAVSDDVAPAWVGTLPAPRTGKGRS